MSAPKPLDFRTALARHVIRRACTPRQNVAKCNAWIALNGPTSSPSGYGPADLQSAYNIAAAAASNGSGNTIAIVDAYDDPNAEADLAVYRSHYGLPACTTANGCFKKVNENGVQGSYPAPSPTSPRGQEWALEISLDLDMVSANCPHCSILLVEANGPGTGDLAASVTTAATFSGVRGHQQQLRLAREQLRVRQLRLSLQPAGDPGDRRLGRSRQQHAAGVRERQPALPGRSGERAGHRRNVARSRRQRARLERDGVVGRGQRLQRARAAAGVAAVERDDHERVLEPRGSDISYDSDPTTPVVFYDSYDSAPGGWWNAGGTSVAAPSVAAIYGGLGTGFSDPSQFYFAAGNFNDVTSGSNGACANALCVAQAGWDGPTGLGSPNGIYTPQSTGGPCSCPPPIHGRPQPCVDCATAPPFGFSGVSTAADRRKH